MSPLDLLQTLTILAVCLIAGLLATLAWLRKVRASTEPKYELEKLMHCRACGSLVPEDVGRCAFCGALQKTENK